jgi:hypothetical protein
MQAFIIEGPNRPGELARQTSVIAERDINAYCYSIGLGSRGASAFLAADEAGLKNALTGAGIKYREVPVLTITLEDKPGTALKAARKLADAGVNIELFAPVQTLNGLATIAVGVDNVAEAGRALSDQLVDWKVPQPVHAGMSSR